MPAKRLMFTTLAAAGLSMAAAQPALADRFACRASDATYFVAVSPEEPDLAYASTAFDPPLDHKQMEFVLRAQPTGSGFRYAIDFAEFYGKGEEAVLVIDGRQVPCAYGGPVEPVAAPARLDAPGQSLGGRVRSGPGMEYDHVGSLAEGTPIVIERNAGVRFNNYDWFEIRAGQMRGFQWGGIMCSQGQVLEGMFQQCGMPPQ